MRMDTLKTSFTYVIALVVLVGSGYLLLTPTPDLPKDQLLPFITAVVGAVIAYVFAREQTQIVQSGNGLERGRLDDVNHKLDTMLLNTSAAAAGPHTVQAERVDVEADHVSVERGSAG